MRRGREGANECCVAVKEKKKAKRKSTRSFKEEELRLEIKGLRCGSSPRTEESKEGEEGSVQQ